MIKRILPACIAFLLLSLISVSQIVNEQVDFNQYVSPSDNDLVNHFYGMQSLIDIPANGITGRSLLCPDSNNWGNDNSRYCSKYSCVHGSPFSTEISFYYDASLVRPGGFDRAVSIWLQPHADPNHYIIATVSHDAKIEMYSYYAFTPTALPMTLQTGHWYNLRLWFHLPFAPNPFYVNYSANVDDLGATGLSAPVRVDSVGAGIIDTVFTSDNAVEISITGARYGGAGYLDNFSFSGVKSADSCLFTGIHLPENNREEINIHTENNRLIVEGNNLINHHLEIYDVSGRRAISSSLLPEKNLVDIGGLLTGIYFVAVSGSATRFVSRIAVIR